MELVEGDTLATRLRKGPLPSDLVLEYGIGIARALRGLMKEESFIAT